VLTCSTPFLPHLLLLAIIIFCCGQYEEGHSQAHTPVEFAPLCLFYLSHVILLFPVTFLSSHILYLSPFLPCVMQMSLRTFDHLLHYGELPVKRVVPLALAMLYVSNPDYSVIDQLSRLSHDQVSTHTYSRHTEKKIVLAI
jgi:hypothetical protein